MGEKCETCEKLTGNIATLDAKVVDLEAKLETALDDLATANGDRDEAIRKANKIAKDYEASGGTGVEGLDPAAEPGDPAEPGFLERALNWPF